MLKISASVYAQGVLEWSATNKLTIDDFRLAIPDSARKQTLILTLSLETHLDKDEIKNLKTFNAQIVNVFSPKDSWIDWTDASRLRYANTLFDLNEWHARELRKRCNQNRNAILAGNSQKIKDQVQKELGRIRQQYDAETDYGNNPLSQMNWETLITDRLTALSDYCKTCGSR
jgi:hypothetical protein